MKISNKQYLLQGFYLKIVQKSALHVYFPPFQVLFSHIFGYHLKGIDELITYMPSKVKGTAIFVEEMSGTSALSIFCSDFLF